MNLTKEELQDVSGGSLKLTVAGVLIAVGGAAAFAIGVLKGFASSTSCSLKRK